MKKCYPLILFALLLNSTSGWSQMDSIMHDGENRTYILFTPDNYTASKTYPLVINMHGNGSDAPQQQFYSSFDDVADTAEVIVAYPNGIGNAWNVGFVIPDTLQDDVGFISKLIDTISANYSIDENRVYAMGMSLGGFMSYRLACELNDRIAAIASVTGSMALPLYSSCNPNKNIPVLQIHGTADSTVPYDGSFFAAPIDSVIAFWTSNNTCPGSPMITQLANTSTSDNCTVAKYEYLSCAENTEVVFYKIDDGGHTWPGAPILIPAFGNTNLDIEASVEIWNFLRKYTVDGSPVAVKSIERNNGFTIYPNPATDRMVIESAITAPKSFRVFDLNGMDYTTVVQQENLGDGHFVMHLSQLPPAIYFLSIMDKDGNYRMERFVKY